MNITRKQLIEIGTKAVIEKEGAANVFGLTSDFVEGAREGVAEVIGMILKEGASDILEEITD